ncbi:pli1, partial [Symbiodinium necroappetens]
MIQRSRSTDTNHTMSRPFDTLHGLTQFGADAVQGSVLGSWRQDLETDIATGISGLLHDERSRDEGRESGDSDSSFESCETPMPQRGGLRYWAPRLYAWLAPRVGNRARCAIALTFAVLEGSKERAWDFAGHEVNYLSIQVMACAVSLTIALCISFFMEGQWGAIRVFSFAALWRWSFVGLLFAAKSVLLTVTVESGLHHVIFIMMDNLYVIVAAVVSFFVFSRLYGKLEWLSLSMLVLSSPAFFIMRERCDINYCGYFDFKKSDANFLGIISAFFGISVGAVASVLSERIFKNLSRGLELAHRDYTLHGRYYIHRVHLDFVTFVLLGAVWTWQYYYNHGTWGSRTDVMFGSWSKRHFVLLFLTVGQMWWAGLVVQHFSTVTKSLIQTVVGVLSACLVDPIVGITLGHNWGIRSIPSTLIAVLVFICAILFQTGRLNVKFLWKATGFTPKRELGGLQAFMAIICPSNEHREEAADTTSPLCGYVLKYSLPVLYIVSNALQTEFQNAVSANRFFVPQSLQVGIPFCGMGLACVLTINIHGLEGLKQAFDPKNLPKFLLLGFLQSVVGALAGLSMGLGINSSLYVAMGKIYTPLSLVLGRWILKRKYLWIEWLSVTALFDASITLAFMDAAVAGSKAGKTSSVAAILCVAASASVACIYSVIMEVALQKTTTPFIVNKIRLDFGAFLWSIAFLPVMGYLGVQGGRPDLAFWVYRPKPYWDCQPLGSCDATSGAFISSNVTASQDLQCVCGRGILLGWDSWIVYAALAAGVLYSWLTGKVIEHFSTVMRSVFDGFPIVLLWFVISPTTSRIPLQAFRDFYNSGPIPYINRDWGKDLMTIVNPLSAITYIEAAAQVREVLELRRNAADEAEIAALSSDDDSTEGTTESLPGDDCLSEWGMGPSPPCEVGDGGEDEISEEIGADEGPLFGCAGFDEVCGEPGACQKCQKPLEPIEQRLRHNRLCNVCCFREQDPFKPVEVDHVLYMAVLPGRHLAFTLEVPDLRLWRKQGFEVELRGLRRRASSEPQALQQAWPSFLSLLVNGKEVFATKVPLRGHKRRDVPQSLSASLRRGTNSVEVTAEDERRRDYLLAVVRTLPLKPQDLAEGVQTAEYKECLERVQQILVSSRTFSDGSDGLRRPTPSTAPSDGDGVECVGDEHLKLLCPITLTRPTTLPVRGKGCRHLQCLDLDAYLISNYRMKAFNSRWRCPTCSFELRPRDLIVDSFVQMLLDQTAEETEEVLVLPDGSWRLGDPVPQ